MTNDHRRVDAPIEEPTERPWCDNCDAWRTPSEVRSGIDGVPVCRTCGGEIVYLEEEDPPKAPWHFKILLLGTIGYVIYRIVWFIQWIGHH